MSVTTVGDTGKLPAEAFPLSDPRKADIRLGQLLAMTSGIRGNNPGIVRGNKVILDPAGPDGGSRRGICPRGTDVLRFALLLLHQGRWAGTACMWCRRSTWWRLRSAAVTVSIARVILACPSRPPWSNCLPIRIGSRAPARLTHMRRRCGES